MKKYEYMVIYSFDNGTGRMQIITEKPISTYDDIKILDEIIKETSGLNKAFAIDFKLLRRYRE